MGDRAHGHDARRWPAHSVRLRNSQPAAASVTTEMRNSGTVFFATSDKGIALRNTPRATTRKYRSGFTSVTGCSQAGMFSIGVANPESSVAGTRNTKAPRIACCCVAQSDEMKRPIPATAARKNSALPYLAVEIRFHLVFLVVAGVRRARLRP